MGGPVKALAVAIRAGEFLSLLFPLLILVFLLMPLSGFFLNG